MSNTFKIATTTREYKTKYGRLEYEITVPAGSRVTNQTALGYDDNCRFLEGVPTKTLVGFDAPMLAHDINYYGLNIPAEYCSPYPV